MLNTDHYYRCLFGCHVLKGAYVIGLVGVIFELLSLIYIFVFSFLSDAPFLWYHYVFNVISFLTYLILMSAIKTERPQLVWPYLIGNTLCVFFDAILIIALLTYHSELVNHQHPELSPKKEHTIAITSLLYAILVVISLLINIYCMRVVWRAKKYLQHTNIQSPLYHLTGASPYRQSRWGVREDEKPGLLVVT